MEAKEKLYKSNQILFLEMNFSNTGGKKNHATSLTQ